MKVKRRDFPKLITTSLKVSQIIFSYRCVCWVLQGEEGWSERRRVGSAWININLIDVNDNTPTLAKDHAHRTVPEDAPQGMLLATFAATDADGVSQALSVASLCHVLLYKDSIRVMIIGINGH